MNQNRVTRKTRGFRGNNHLPAPMSFPIRTAYQIHLGVSTQNTLSGQLLQQSREGVDPPLPVSFTLHYGSPADTRELVTHELALQGLIPAC